MAKGRSDGRGIPPVVSVTFTGTRKGMTRQQRRTVEALLVNLQPDVVHHGDCLGADADFDAIAKRLGIRRILHPCHLPNRDPKTYRAFCHGDIKHKPLPPLARNREMIKRCQTLIAAPKEFTSEMRSGTWATIRYGLADYRVDVTIVWPDGSTETNKGPFR